MNWKHLSPAERAAISRRWREEGSRYARDVNAFMERCSRLGPKQAGEAPHDSREDLTEAVLEAVREANEAGRAADIREDFPPAYFPFLELIKAKGQHLAPLFCLASGQVLVRAGSTTYLIDDLRVETVPGVLSFGRSPDRRYFAVARQSGITIHDGWGGPTVTGVDWPTIGTRGGDHTLEQWSRAGAKGDQIVPFPDGKRVLLATRDAIVVVEPHSSTILFPGESEESEDIWLNKPHGAVSPDGSLIAVGDRLTGAHLIFNDRYERVGEIAGLVDLAPWHASFSDDGAWLALSSFMLYQGATVLVPTRRFPGLVVGEKDLETHWFSKASWDEMRQGLNELDQDLLVLSSRSSAYASAWRPGEFILGDAQGFLRAFDRTGAPRWNHFIGSSINALDISADGRRLFASSAAGFLVILDLDTGEADPYAIGTSTHRERRRWVFWKDETRPLAW
jgi:hypothetical protein